MIFQPEPRIAHGLNAAPVPIHFFSKYRIQLRDEDTDQWRVYANFEFYGEAEACLYQLLHRGIEARLDSHRPCFTSV